MMQLESRGSPKVVISIIGKICAHGNSGRFESLADPSRRHHCPNPPCKPGRSHRATLAKLFPPLECSLMFTSTSECGDNQCKRSGISVISSSSASELCIFKSVVHHFRGEGRITGVKLGVVVLESMFRK